MLLELLAERVAVDAEPGGGLELHALAVGEHLGDQFPFHAADDAVEQVLVVGAGRHHALLHEVPCEAVEIAATAGQGNRRPVARHRRWQEVERELVAGGHHHTPLDHVLQFADVARPVILRQRRRGLFLDVHDVAVVSLVVVFEEVAHQLWNILPTGPQRRQVDRHDVETVVEVLAEVFLRHLIEQFAVARRDHSRVDADRLGVAHPLKLAFLQNPQELHLQLRRGGVDLVEKDRAGVGGLEPPGAVGDRAGERAADVAEEFALQQALGERAAIDADEGTAASRRKLVDRLGDKLLAGAGLAHKQDRRIRHGHPPRHGVDLHHRRPRPDQALDRGAGVVTVLAWGAQHRRRRGGPSWRAFQ